MKKQLRMAAFVLPIALLTACGKSNDDQPAPVTPPVAKPAVSNTVLNLNADAGNKGSFTLFSLADNKVIPNSDSATTKWDIGFRSTTIIINGGISGPGKAEAQVLSGIFKNLTEAPASGYAADSTKGNAITGWYSYNMQTHIITPVAGKFFVIKTATGKFAKIEVYSYYKDAPTPPTGTSVSRHYNFRYTWQADGSRNLK